MPENKGIILVGYGRHAVSVISTLLRLNIPIKGYVDQQQKQDDPYHLQYYGTDAAYLKKPEPSFFHFCTIGDNKYREAIQRRYEHAGLKFTNVIHPTACIEQNVELGSGIFIGAMSYLNGLVRVGDGAILNNHSNLEHGCTIGSFSHLAPGVCLTGEVNIGDRVFIGASSVVIPEKKIGSDATIGAGSVVVRNVETGKTVYGNPAK